MTAIFGTAALVYFVVAAALSGITIVAGARTAGRTGFTPTMLVR